MGARFSAPVQTGPEAHPTSCTIGTDSFLGVICGRGVTLTLHPLLVPRSKIEYSYTSTLLKGLRGLWQGETYLYTTYCFPMRPANEPAITGVAPCHKKFGHPRLNLLNQKQPEKFSRWSVLTGLPVLISTLVIDRATKWHCKRTVQLPHDAIQTTAEGGRCNRRRAGALKEARTKTY